MEAKIKMNNCKVIDKRMLDKWNYNCNQNLSNQKSFASTKTLKQDQDFI